MRMQALSVPVLFGEVDQHLQRLGRFFNAKYLVYAGVRVVSSSNYRGMVTEDEGSIRDLGDLPWEHGVYLNRGRGTRI
jgi:hypothetical protein